MHVILGVWVLLRAVERAVERAVVRVVVRCCALRAPRSTLYWFLSVKVDARIPFRQQKALRAGLLKMSVSSRRNVQF